MKSSTLFPLALSLAISTCLILGCTESKPEPTATSTKAPPTASKIGIELDGVGDGSRSMPFIDVAKTLRPFSKANSNEPATLDQNGWPTCDAQTVFFDIRPFPAWAPPIDDPQNFQPDWSGTYKLSFTGQATLGFTEGQNKVENQKYDAKANTTTADVVVPKGSGLLVMTFTNTSRTAISNKRSGITNIRLIRPGYSPDTTEVFTKEFLTALKPFAALRYMDLLETNHNPGFYGDTGHHMLEWNDRHVPADATQQTIGTKYGIAWEYIAKLANQTGKDAWINIPVAASDDYVRQLADFLKKELKPEIKIYIEHSNEVWNFGFPQYIYNKLAAIDEVKKGGTTLDNDGSKDEETWTHRRHAKRLHDIAEIFRKSFGDAAMITRIRPIYASWVISPGPHFKDVLTWFNTTYGPPKKFFYGMAGAAYYNSAKASDTASPAEILKVMKANSDENMVFHKQLKAIADEFALKYTQYEIGPDNGGGKVENVANRIAANRLPAMKDLVKYDADKWFEMGGDMYMYFAAPGGYSRHGCWGISEDIKQLNTPKWQAIYELTGTRAP